MLWIIIGAIVTLIIIAIAYHISEPLNIVLYLISIIAFIVCCIVPYRTDAYDTKIAIRDEHQELKGEIAASKGVKDGISKELYDRIIAHNEKANQGCGSEFWEDSFTGFGYNAQDYIIDTTDLKLVESCKTNTTTQPSEETPPATMVIDDNVYVLQTTTIPTTIVVDGNVYVRQD